MEIYSPSHPTDDIDSEGSDELMSKGNSDKSVDINIEPKNNLPVSNWKSDVTSKEDVLYRIVSDMVNAESQSRNKQLISIEPNSLQIPNRLSRSKSKDIFFTSKSGFKISRSRSRSMDKSRDSRSRSQSRSRSRIYYDDSTNSVVRPFNADRDYILQKGRYQESYSQYGVKPKFGKIVGRGFQTTPSCDQNKAKATDEDFRDPELLNTYWQQNDYCGNPDALKNRFEQYQEDYDSEEEVRHNINKHFDEKFPRNNQWEQIQPFYAGRYGSRNDSHQCSSNRIDEFKSQNNLWEPKKLNYVDEYDIRNKPWADFEEHNISNEPWEQNNPIYTDEVCVRRHNPLSYTSEYGASNKLSEHKQQSFIGEFDAGNKLLKSNNRNDLGDYDSRRRSREPSRQDFEGEYEGRGRPWQSSFPNDVGEYEARRRSREPSRQDFESEYEGRCQPWKPSFLNDVGEYEARRRSREPSRQDFESECEAMGKPFEQSIYEAISKILGQGRYENVDKTSGEHIIQSKTWNQNSINLALDNIDDYESRNKPLESDWANSTIEREMNMNVTGYDRHNSSERVLPTPLCVFKNDENSEDEYDIWDKKDKVGFEADIEHIGGWGRGQSTNRSLEPHKAFVEVHDWENEPNKDGAQDDNNRMQGKGSLQSNTREGTEGGFVAWKNAQKAAAVRMLEEAATISIKAVEGLQAKLKGTEKVQAATKTCDVYSDEEFSSWCKEQRLTKTATKDDSLRKDPHVAVEGSTSQDQPSSSNQLDQWRDGHQTFPDNGFQGPPNHQMVFNNFLSAATINYNNEPQTIESVTPIAPSSRRPTTNNYQQSQQPTPPMACAPGSQLTCGGNADFLAKLSQQLYVPTNSMMEELSFIPPPPPSLPMDTNKPSKAPGGAMSSSGSRSTSLDQSTVNKSHSDNTDQSKVNKTNFDKSTSKIAQNSNLSQQLPNKKHTSDNIVPTTISAAKSSVDTILGNANFLETLMTRAGLNSDSLRLNQEKKPEESISANDTFNNILQTAANSVILRLVESSQQKPPPPPDNDNMSMSPPSPPPDSPPSSLSDKHSNNPVQFQPAFRFVPPPLPSYADVLKPSTNQLTKLPTTNKRASEIISEKSSEIDEAKRNRSDFQTKFDWQERLAVEVKLFLKPAFVSHSIDKNDYKEIMKRCVTKITRSGVTEINTEKIEKFVLSYLGKYNKNKRARQRGAVSSSDHDPNYD